MENEQAARDAALLAQFAEWLIAEMDISLDQDHGIPQEDQIAYCAGRAEAFLTMHANDAALVKAFDRQWASL